MSDKTSSNDKTSEMKTKVDTKTDEEVIPMITHPIPYQKVKTVNQLMVKLGYDFKGQLGKGRFGYVHKVLKTDKKSGSNQVMACKQIQIKTEKLEEMERSFRFEIYVLKRAKHPYIIGLFDYFLVNNNNQKIAYLFLEFANGDTLEYEIRYAVFTEDNSRRLFAQMATGLAFLHRLKIAHKDLKPRNVLIVIDPKTGAKDIRISDFGLSQMVDNKEKASIRSGHFAGTRDYMAPEIIKQEINKDKPSAEASQYDPFISDRWALGVCLYEMLTQSVPFDSSDLKVMLENQKTNSWTKGMTRLVRSKVEWNAIDLLTRLLESEIPYRLTQSGLLDHPWIRDHIDWSLLPTN